MVTELNLMGLKGHTHFEEMYKRQIESLLDESPSDADAQAELTEVNEKYQGILRIVSSQGKFVAEAVNANINDLMKTLSQQIHRQLREWRCYRFQAE